MIGRKPENLILGSDAQSQALTNQKTKRAIPTRLPGTPATPDPKHTGSFFKEFDGPGKNGSESQTKEPRKETISESPSKTDSNEDSQEGNQPNVISMYEGEFKDGKGKKTYPHGRTYTGQLNNGKRHGHGTFTWSNKSTYMGQWKYGKMDGEGIMTYPDGRTYEGNFENNQRHGHGTMTYADRSTYTGQWNNGKRDGQGTFTWPDGSSYTGEWVDNKMHGEGTLITWGDPVEKDEITYIKGSKKEGTFVNGEMSKSVRIVQVIRIEWPDGSTYKGQFKDGKPPQPQGEGTMTWPDGRTFEGEFKDGEPHGKGTFKWPDGRTYTGQWKYGSAWNLHMAGWGGRTFEG